MLLCLYSNFLCCYTLYNICIRQQDAKVSRFIRKPLFRGVILDFFKKKLRLLFAVQKKAVPLHMQLSGNALQSWDMV